eukprot:TRINITY_DN51399_c0_g1_i1.p2 TRINITY_DN51399_c0_g1~~TRINITY_DN51399_c0_g1_i1.p2  ORF type:complete len:238 (+),score=49.23 TRINITY_DN51399_c0_g1_i1:57-716(+)
MKRVFGKSGPKKQAPNLADTSAVLEKRGDVIDQKIAKLDQELLGYKKQMAQTRGPGQARLKQKALHVLKQKKMYEQQRDQLGAQQFNVDNLQFTTETARCTMEQVGAMKDAAKSLKKEMKHMKVHEIEKFQDDLQDIYDDVNDIQEIMGRSYGVPDEVDEDDLEAELACLGDDMGVGDASYLDDALSTPSGAIGDGSQPAQQQTVDETDPAQLEKQLGL